MANCNSFSRSDGKQGRRPANRVLSALVVAYPYVPGSDSAALKGITVFIGIVFSLSSTSALANIIVGYSLTYRRAFKVGDRVKIGDTIGDVTQIICRQRILRRLGTKK